jgi:hypothetical protein
MHNRKILERRITFLSVLTAFAVSLTSAANLPAETINFKTGDPMAVNPVGQFWSMALSQSGGYTPGAEDSIFPGSSSGNNVSVSGISGSGPEFVYGGLANSGNSSGNSVIISDSESVGAVGAITMSGDVYDNTVTIGDNNSIDYGVMGTYTSLGDSYNNKVIFSGENSYADALGGGHTSQGDSYDNSVVMSAGTIEGDGITGGSTYYGTARNNSVAISGGYMPGPGGMAFIVGGMTTGGDARENRLSISGGEFGYDYPALFSAGLTYVGNASGNETTISGGLVVGDSAMALTGVYGGFSLLG